MLDEQTTKDLIKKMLEKQDELNTHTNGPTWKFNTDLKWSRAIWIECAELMDYTGWKWWKHQELQLDDIKIEVIDIWHFALSDLMVHYDLNTCINEIYNNFKKIFDEITIFDINKVRELTETFTYWTLRNNRFNIVPFVKLCLALNVSFEEIYKLYMGKNILNKFRQNNGYKTGNYKKIWDGQEDNVYLTIILKETEISNINFDIIVYDKLTEKYQSV